MIKKSIFLLLIISATLLSGQHIRTSVDWALFDLDQSNGYLEIYYSFLQSDLTFVDSDGILKGGTVGQFHLLQNEQVVKTINWKAETTIRDSSELALANEIIDKIAFPLPTGDFDCRFVLTDVNNPQNSDSLRWHLKVPAHKSTEPHLSEIEIAKSINYSQDTSSLFYKNGLLVEPNPTLVFGFSRPVLFFYVEAYHLQHLALQDSYYLKYSVLSADGAAIKSMPGKMVLKKEILDSSVEFGMVNVGRLATGKYFLQVEITDANRQALLKQSKAFYILQQSELMASQPQQAVEEQFARTPFANMDSSAVEREFQIVYYLLTKEAQLFHKQLENLEQKRRFLFNFWQLHVPGTGAENSKKRQDYLVRHQQANELYKALGIEGWQTDRGRVHMVYGRPDDIERYPNEANKYPYEIWHYHDLQNGVIFVFADLEGYNNYRLIHSDLLGEINDPNYRSILTRGY